MDEVTLLNQNSIAVTSLAILVVLWKERNDRIFDGKMNSSKFLCR